MHTFIFEQPHSNVLKLVMEQIDIRSNNNIINVQFILYFNLLNQTLLTQEK